jgi:hypothetical protein
MSDLAKVLTVVRVHFLLGLSIVLSIVGTIVLNVLLRR